MILDPHSAAQFIQGYKTLLLEIDAEVSGNGAPGALEKLVAAREQLRKDRSLLKKGLDRMKAKNLDISSAVIQAVEDIQIERWIYLLDTKHQSIFIHPQRPFRLRCRWTHRSYSRHCWVFRRGHGNWSRSLLRPLRLRRTYLRSDPSRAKLS